MRQAKSSGYFPIYLGPAAVGTERMTLDNMAAPYGYNTGGYIGFDGVDDAVRTLSMTGLSGKSWTVVIRHRPAGTVGRVWSIVGGDPTNEYRLHYNSNDEEYVSFYSPQSINKNESFMSTGDVKITSVHYTNGRIYYRSQAGDLIEIGNPELFTEVPNDPFIFRLCPDNTYTGRIYETIIFYRMLTSEEDLWLHQQSALGFPGMYAYAYGNNLEYAEITNNPPLNLDGERVKNLKTRREGKFNSHVCIDTSNNLKLIKNYN